MKTVVCTLVLLTRPGEVLLARGKKGVSKDFWNGYGGKVDEGESIEQAAIRELEEESGVKANESDLKKAAIMRFVWESPPTGLGVAAVKVVEMHAFILEQWHGEPQESGAFEVPKWFAHDAVPYVDMFPGEREWLSQVLAGQMVQGTVTYYYDSSGKVCVKQPTS